MNMHIDVFVFQNPDFCIWKSQCNVRLYAAFYFSIPFYFCFYLIKKIYIYTSTAIHFTSAAQFLSCIPSIPTSYDYIYDVHLLRTSENLLCRLHRLVI